MGENPLLYMVIERFHDRNARPVYERVDQGGRRFPAGLRYLDSWVEPTFERCFQLMECDDEALLHEWADQWRDLVDFEFLPVVTSAEARRLALG
jgi:hypothetical protein